MSPRSWIFPPTTLPWRRTAFGCSTETYGIPVTLAVTAAAGGAPPVTAAEGAAEAPGASAARPMARLDAASAASWSGLRCVS